MDKKLSFKKGDKCIIAIEEGSNLARYLNNLTLENIDEWTKECEIISVGRKYITINNGKKFDITNNYREKWDRGGANYKLYNNLQEVKNEYEAKRLSIQIFNKADCNLTLDQLKRIYAIMQE